MYNVIADLRFNKSALSNCSFVKAFLLRKVLLKYRDVFSLPSVICSINLWEALQVYQGNHQGVLEETLLERLRSFGGLLAPILGSVISSWKFVFQEQPPNFVARKQTDQSFHINFC